MKRYLATLLFPLLVVFSCTPENNDNTEENPEFVMPEYIVADVSGKVDRYDKVVFKDDEHVIFSKYYDNGAVSEYCIISEKDTLGIFYSDNGFPKYITNGHQHLIMGDFSEHSALVGIVQENGEYEVHDIETNTNWLEYKKQFEETASFQTKGKLENKELELLQSTAADQIFSKCIEKMTGVGGNPMASYFLWAGSAIAYSVSDNATWWSFVDSVNEGIGNTLLLFQLAQSPVTLTLTLIIANFYVWTGVACEIYDGIKNDNFHLPIVNDPEMFAKEIDGGVWFKTPSPAVIDWQAQQVNAYIAFGIANFDLMEEGAIEIGIRENISLPEGCSAKIIREGREYALSVSVPRNDFISTEHYRFQVFIAGVANVQEDIVFEIQQTPRIQFSPREVFFKDLSPITVTVTSPSKEYWTVASCPEWLDYNIDWLATRSVNSITLTPKSLDGASEGDIVFSVTSGDGKSKYTTFLPVHPEEVNNLRAQLIKLYNDTDGENWVHNDNWCSDLPIEQWYGISRNTDNGDYFDYYIIDLRENNLKGEASLTLSEEDEVYAVYLSDNLLTSIEISGESCLTWLDCEHNNLTSLNVNGCSSLQYLLCLNNNIKSLNVNGCSSLQSLDCQENSLTSLDVSECSSLQYLLCHNNNLTSLNVNGYSSLKQLYCRDNHLKSLNVRGCSSLKQLFCDNNNLTSLNVSGCSSLQELSCENNNLTSLDVSECSSLLALAYTHGNLKSLNVSGCSSLQTLCCWDINLTSLNLSGCSSLQKLYCYNNNLTSLNVSECSSLQVLYCYNNPIIQEITSTESRLSTFSYDQRYSYYYDSDGNVQWYYNKEDGTGWYYPGEPSKGYHGW